MTYLKELGEGIQYLQRDRFMHLERSREEPFSPPMFYTRPPRPSHGSAGWVLKYSLLFPVSS